MDTRSDELVRVPTEHWGLALSNTYAMELAGLHTPWSPTPAPRPDWLALNTELAIELGIDALALSGADGLSVLSGRALPEGVKPVAQAYAGHQFGHFSPQLGDGRALLLGEIVDTNGERRDIAFKGSGRTPFSRGGDGKASVGPVLREYLMGEAMQALGIPTTRGLAAVATGEQVQRERSLPGALLVRVASSHLRVGSFQFFAARNELEKLKRLADYAIARHDPVLEGQADRYLRFLKAVAERQAALIAKWMGVGFVHGVMNTDNMGISGETIDYGPCAFLDAFDPHSVFSSIDRQGRYAYTNQPHIARWNLARLAEALLPLMGDDTDKAVGQATEVIDAFPALYQAQWLAVMRRKLGLADTGHTVADAKMAEDFLLLLQSGRVDFTQAFRALAGFADAEATSASALMALLPPEGHEAMWAWLHKWWILMLQSGGTGAEIAQALRSANPVYIPRNHLVEEALEAASESGDMAPFERLLRILKRPFVEQTGCERFAMADSAERQASYRTFCGT